MVITLKNNFYLFYYLFIWSVPDLLLCRLFCSCSERGLLSSCGARASHRGGFSCCGAQALGTWSSAVEACGFSSCGSWALEHRLNSYGAWT